MGPFSHPGLTSGAGGRCFPAVRSVRVVAMEAAFPFSLHPSVCPSLCPAVTEHLVRVRGLLSAGDMVVIGTDLISVLLVRII